MDRESSPSSERSVRPIARSYQEIVTLLSLVCGLTSVVLGVVVLIG